MFTLVFVKFQGRFNSKAVEKNTRTVHIFNAQQGHKLPGLILIKLQYFFLHSILFHSKYILILEICSVGWTMGCRKKSLCQYNAHDEHILYQYNTHDKHILLKSKPHGSILFQVYIFTNWRIVLRFYRKTLCRTDLSLPYFTEDLFFNIR